MAAASPKPGRSIRLSLTTLVAILLALPVLVVGAQRSMRTMLNAPPLWVPASLPYRQDFDWFREHFHCEDVLLLSYEGCVLDDPRVDQLTVALSSPAPDDPDAATLNMAIESATSGPRLLRELLDSGLDLSRRVALARLRGSFIGPDGRSTCLLVTLTLEGTVHRAEALEAIVRTTQRVAGVTEHQVHMAGAPVDGAAIDAASVKSLDRLALPSSLFAAALCLGMLRSPSLAGAIILVSLFGQALVLAAVWLSGARMNAVLIVMPALVFVLTVSAGVHLANYFRDGWRAAGAEGATRFALRAGFWPCTLAAATTVIGLLSLLVSRVSPIRMFGVISSIGVGVCLLLLFASLPGVMKWAARHGANGPAPPRSSRAWFERGLDVVCRWINLAPVSVSIAFLVAMAVLAWGVASTRTSVSVQSLFRPDSRILADYEWLQERIGPLISLEVIVQFPDDSPLEPFEQLQLVRDVHVATNGVEGLGGTLSAATFFPAIPATGRMRAVARRGVLRGMLNDALPALEQSDYVSTADGMRSWRVSSRASVEADLNYGAVLDRLRAAVQPVVDAHAESGATAFYTGSLPVAYEAQRALLSGLFRSFLTAFALVAVVMMIVMRGVAPGVVAMLPNLFPTLMMFGLMGWLGEAVDIGAVMTASVALGIAVDDTLHFLIWWRREKRAGRPRLDAVRASCEACGRAMTQTTLICGLGLLIYGFSDFAPTQRFAWFMLGLLASALVGDLIFLPSLLLGPAARWFGVEADAPAEDAPPAAVAERAALPSATP